MSRFTGSTLLLLVIIALGGTVRADDAEAFKPIFDGESLDGWESRNPDFWSVEDGSIVARSTEDHRPETNSFLVWQDGEVGDFELRLQIRISGHEGANSGVQIRSEVQEDGHLRGYQADYDLNGTFLGAVYDEHRRGMLAERGQRTVVDPDGNLHVTEHADRDALLEHVDPDGWNDYHIIAVGPHIVTRVNGQLMAEVTDLDAEHQTRRGVIGLQLHAGAAPTTIEFRNIRLRHLDGSQ